jgi:hypothetical protein
MQILRALVLLSTVTLPLAAQQASYRFSTNDTLRYHEVTEGRIELRPGPDTVILKTRHDAKIALLAERGDTVTAWYEELVPRRSLTASAGRNIMIVGGDPRPTS